MEELPIEPEPPDQRPDNPSAPPPRAAPTHFISPSGNDTTGDGSKTKPWRTVKKAYEMASPGAVIEMAAGTYPRHYETPIAYDAAKVVGFTLPTAPGQSDDRWVARPVTFTVAPGATVRSEALYILAGGIELDGTGGSLTLDYLQTSSTSKVVLRALTFAGSSSLNSFAALGMVDCLVGKGRAVDSDVVQTKADSSGLSPRNWYVRRTVFVSAVKPLGSSNHVDTIQIGGMDGLWFEESYVMADRTPRPVQGFFAKGWTGPTQNAQVHKTWSEYTNISEPDTFVRFFDCQMESPFNIDPGHGDKTGSTSLPAGTLRAWYDAGKRPWD